MAKELVKVPLWLAPWILCTVLSQLLCISIAERLFSLRLGPKGPGEAGNTTRKPCFLTFSHVFFRYLQ